MNKKVLSAILFSALFACTGTFTSCIDNDEPEGIENLRGAKAELLRAKVEVEKANAQLILAKAEVQKAEAARLESLAKINEASARLEEARAEAQEIQNEEDRAVLEKTIAEYEMYLEKAALEHELTMTQTQQNLAIVKRQYELALKAIEIAEALMSEEDQVYVSELKTTVGEWLAEVERLEHEIEKQQDVLYDAAKYIGAETEFQIAKAEYNVNAAKATLEANALEIEKYKKYLEIDSTATESDWRKEIAAIEAEEAEYSKKIAVYELELTKAMESDTVKALAAAVTAAEDAKRALEAPKVAEDLTYAYKYFAGSQEIEGKIAKDELMSDAIDAITGEGNTIDQLKAEKASYTNEFQAYLKALAADENLQDLDKKQAEYADAKAKWAAALTAYSTAKTTAAEVTFTTPEAALKAYNEAIAAASVLATEKKIAAEIKAKQAFADALVAWYNTLPADQVTFNKLTLKIDTYGKKADGSIGVIKSTYTTKTAKEWLSDSEYKDVYLTQIVDECFNANGASNGFRGYWGKGSELEKLNDLTTEDTEDKYTTAKDAFGTIVKKADLIAAKAADLVAKSDAAFGVATHYIASNYAASVAYKVNATDPTATTFYYLTVEPSESDVKRITNYATTAGALGAYLGYTDEGVIFIAKNLDAILADLDAAIEYWTAAAEEMTESVEAYEADLEAADEAITAAEKALNDYTNDLEEKHSVAVVKLQQELASLRNVKLALIYAVDQYVAADYTGEGSFMEYLAEQLWEAETLTPVLKKTLAEAEADLKAAKEGKFFDAQKVKKEEEKLAKLEEDLAQALEELEKALADLATAESIWAGTAE